VATVTAATWTSSQPSNLVEAPPGPREGLLPVPQRQRAGCVRWAKGLELRAMPTGNRPRRADSWPIQQREATDATRPDGAAEDRGEPTSRDLSQLRSAARKHGLRIRAGSAPAGADRTWDLIADDRVVATASTLADLRNTLGRLGEEDTAGGGAPSADAPRVEAADVIAGTRRRGRSRTEDEPKPDAVGREPRRRRRASSEPSDPPERSDVAAPRSPESIELTPSADPPPSGEPSIRERPGRGVRSGARRSASVRRADEAPPPAAGATPAEDVDSPSRTVAGQAAVAAVATEDTRTARDAPEEARDAREAAAEPATRQPASTAGTGLTPRPWPATPAASRPAAPDRAGACCPRCNTVRQGSFRFCRSCGLDFEPTHAAAGWSIVPPSMDTAPPAPTVRSAVPPATRFEPRDSGVLADVRRASPPVTASWLRGRVDEAPRSRAEPAPPPPVAPRSLRRSASSVLLSVLGLLVLAALIGAAIPLLMSFILR